MKHPVALKVACGLFLVNAVLRFSYLSPLKQELSKLEHERQQDVAKWEEWQRVGKARTAAGSNTEFVPDPSGSEGIRRDLMYLKALFMLHVLVLGVSIGAVAGLLIGWRWTYRLALGYAGIAVAWGLYEFLPIPSVPQMFIYSKQWSALLDVVSRGLLLHVPMLLCLLLPSVKAQFVNSSTKQ